MVIPLTAADGAVTAAEMLPGMTTMKPSKKLQHADRILEELGTLEIELKEALARTKDESLKETIEAVAKAKRAASAQKTACKFFDDDEAEGQSSVYVKRTSLKTFRGDPKEWTSWFESLKVGVLENKTLDDTGKALKILELVEGEAADTLLGVSGTAQNLHMMVAKLARRHGNPAKIILLQMNGF
jgi:hypothetical protein